MITLTVKETKRKMSDGIYQVEEFMGNGVKFAEKYDFVIENEKTSSTENWQEVKTKVQERLDNWRGDEYHDDAKEYRGEVSLNGKVFSFSLFALLDDDGCMSFGNVVSIKRVR